MSALKKVLAQSFDAAIAAIPAALQGEGFGVLTEIDIRDTLQKKLNVAFRRYRILGACNPPLAHQALQADLDVGTMLPCNVAVWEDDHGRAVVSAVDPTTSIAAQNPALRPIADQVRQKLERVIARLE